MMNLSVKNRALASATNCQCRFCAVSFCLFVCLLSLCGCYSRHMANAAQECRETSRYQDCQFQWKVLQAPRKYFRKVGEVQNPVHQSEGDGGCCRNANGVKGDTSKEGFACAGNDNNESASELDEAQEGRRDARMRPRAFQRALHFQSRL